MELRKKTIGFLNRALFPIMLASVIVNMVLRCYYYEMRTAYTALYAVCAVGLFLLFDRLKKRKIIGFLVYVALIVGVTYISSQFSWRGWMDTHIIFTDWFYLNRDTAGFSMDYFLFLYLFGGFFLTSIVYYFTQLRFRSLGVMLCLLFPFVIYAKRADIMSNFDVTLIITLFLAIVVHNQQLFAENKNVRPVRDVPYFVSVALFVSFAGAVAMLIPKPEVTSVLERDSHAFDITPDTRNSGNYSSYTRVSSRRYGASYTNQVLFNAWSDYPSDVFFLKRQAFDEFYNDEWHNSRAGEKYTNYDYYSRLNIDRKRYYESLLAIAQMGRYTDYGFTPEALSVPEQVPYSFRVFDEDDTFRAAYLPSPSGVIAKSFTESLEDPYYLYGDGEISVRNVDRDYDYTVSFYPETAELVKAAADLALTSEQYYDILTDAAEQEAYYAPDLLEQYEIAFSDYTGSVEYTDRMRDLALSITKDCKSDYDKAKALCDYFENGEFTYDLDYVPEDTSIDYFLFEGKTGVCTSYATAMTIMARIVGLPARYVEGFVAYERGDDDSFVIRDSHAHAFVEVFIPGGGWMTFDPTIAGYAIDRSGAGGFSLSTIAEYFSRVFVFLAVLLIVFVIIMLDRIIELVFRARQRFVKGDLRIVKLYARTVRLLEYSSDDDLSAYTSRMIAAFAEEQNNADVMPIVTAFERTCFGGIPLDDELYEKVYAHYKSVYSKLRARPKPEREKTETAPAAS